MTLAGDGCDWRERTPAELIKSLDDQRPAVHEQALSRLSSLAPNEWNAVAIETGLGKNRSQIH